MRSRMRFDDVAWEASETISDSWVAGLFQPDTLRSIGDFMIKHRSGVPTELCQPRAGTFNVSFRMKFDDGGSALIRFPKPGTTMFPEEKVRNEVATMRYIQAHTSIPVPFILHWGTREESPLGLGPFILMEFIEHAMDLGEALNTPTLGVEDRPILDPAVDVEKLEMLYGQLADIVLQLSQCSLPRIGSLVQVDDFTWEPGHRPLSIGMNELVRLGTLPRSKLPTSAFETASEYFQALANLHGEHLHHQRNDAVDSADDCRRRFVARRLFSRVASEGRLASSRNDHGPFKLWCDDLRPSNILLNEHLQIVGVIDWEFTYAAPVQFAHAPPWWLLLEQPEYWPDGLEAWERAFEYRLQTFLKVLVEREETALRRGRLTPEQRLSGPMRHSWENGDFWVAYAARKSFAFDVVFWKKLDPRFFGSCAIAVQDRWKERLGLLSEEETRCMEQIWSIVRLFG
ncbi:phosphotransferase family protein [Aspergillus indologenus CBS 114.80]|uniref:Phosphotransferase family protein n=1 Tax=Aspergillus indologenus CBS 114.80 TaxID=1450541 RepID=A0A2V5IFR5_9EURO|nr:phosphotransferase family protein [Aspergillus indologenus CBS 114.80]